MNKCVIVASGPIEHLDEMKSHFDDAYIISVDGGLHHLDYLNIKPDVIIGDFDSIDHALLERYRTYDIPIHSYPSRKDATDSELAIDYAIELSPKEVTLMGMTGKRMDHAITNIHLLKRFWNHDILACVLDYYNRIYYCNGDMTLHGEIGDFVSIVPISQEVKKVRTFGLEYPLENETLRFHESRGVSNVFLEHEVRIETGSGEFLIILSKD